MTSAGGSVEEKYIDLRLELTGPDKRLGAMGKVEKMIPQFLFGSLGAWL